MSINAIGVERRCRNGPCADVLIFHTEHEEIAMNDQTNDQNRKPQQQDQGGQQRAPQQQNEQGQGRGGEKTGERIDTDGDGRTRDPNDTRPTDDGGRGEPVQR